MFCIYQSSNDTIIKIISIHDNFLLKVKDVITIEYTFLNDVSITQLTDTPTYNTGTYLLYNNNTIQLVEKCEIINKGYLYNSTKYNINIIDTWKIIELADPSITNQLLNITNTHNMLQEYNTSQITNKSNFIIIGNNENHKNLIVNKIVDTLDETKIIAITKNKYLLNNKKAIIYDDLWDSDLIQEITDNGNCLLIFDNLVDFNTRILKSNEFANLFYNSKKFNIKIIMTTPIKILSCFKGMADNIFVLQDVNYTSDKLYKNYYNEVLQTSTFNKYFEVLNKDSICMVTCYNEKPETIYYYKIQ